MLEASQAKQQLVAEKRDLQARVRELQEEQDGSSGGSSLSQLMAASSSNAADSEKLAKSVHFRLRSALFCALPLFISSPVSRHLVAAVFFVLRCRRHTEENWAVSVAEAHIVHEKR